MGDPSERLGSDGLDSGAAVKADDLCLEIDPPFQENSATAEDWRKALHKVVPAVVILRSTATRAFDTESAAASYASGFVVDKRRGIILTIATSSSLVWLHPFVVFSKCLGLWFLKSSDVKIIFLNLAGPKWYSFMVSILAGTLARLDRDAPHYKKDGYIMTSTHSICK